MNMLDLIKKNRTYRRFDNSKQLPSGFMGNLIDAARLSQSAANAQPLRYITVTSQDKCAEIYPHLRWAGRLKDWDGPIEAERPTGYVVVLSDTESPAVAMPQVDSGLAMQNMCMFAIEQGIGSCMIGNFVKNEIRQILSIADRYDILWLVAFGYPVENVELTDCDGDVAYYRDDNGNHYVPKRTKEDVQLRNF
jgi:nitroreductase